jgi:hypothetical protein
VPKLPGNKIDLFLLSQHDLDGKKAEPTARAMRTPSGSRLETRIMAAGRSLAADGILQTADGVLDFALDLIGLTFILGLGVTGNFAGPFLDFAFGLLGRTLDTIFVHFDAPKAWFPERTFGARNGSAARGSIGDA